MKVSWRFPAGLVAGFCLVCLAAFAAFDLSLGVPTQTSRWAYEVMQKKRSLAGRAKSPKLLLVGGSSSLFGVSAKELEKETGWPTINLGCHAALGVGFMLDDVRQVAKPGDTVLLVLEYELYNYGKIHPGWADMLLLDYIVARAPDYFHRLSLPEQWNVFMFTSNDRIVQSMKNRQRAEPPHTENPIFDVHKVNEWGDQTLHVKTNRPAERGYVVKSRAPLSSGLSRSGSKDAFAVIGKFCRWAEAHHVRVLATFPNLCDQPEYHTQTAAKVAKTIKDSFARLNVPVIGDYTDSLLPADQFFDTFYHLTEESALERTRRLAVLLKPCLQVRPAEGGSKTLSDSGTGNAQ